MSSAAPCGLNRALTAAGDTYDNLSRDGIFDRLSEMNMRFPFLILERMDGRDPSQHYIQAYLGQDDSCLVEYRDGSDDHHFHTIVPSPWAMSGHAKVAQLIVSWAEDGDDWVQCTQSFTWLRGYGTVPVSPGDATSTSG